MVSWMQTEMASVDDAELTSALSRVPPPPQLLCTDPAGDHALANTTDDGRVDKDQDSGEMETKFGASEAGLVEGIHSLSVHGENNTGGHGKGLKGGAGARRRGGGLGGESSAASVSAASEAMRLREEHKKADKGWQRMQALRGKLPAAQQAAAIVATVRGAAVTVISGETGCGKTTQVPQFLLDDLIQRGEGGIANMVCTQPRRLSAIGVAERVACERGESLGDTVGYQIRLESKRSKDTRLLFCTTGILLRRLAQEVDLPGVTHVIVDEVHERAVDGDLLLILLARLVRRRPTLRVVLMSATLDADKFAAYFALGGQDAPAMHIPGFTHPVTDVYLEECLRLTGQLIGRGSPYALPRDAFLKRKKALEEKKGGGGEGSMLMGIGDWRKSTSVGGDDEEEGAGEDDGSGDGPAEAVGRLDNVQISMLNVDESKINYEMIELLVHHICSAPDHQVPLAQHGTLGAVLVFLPGMGEIQRAFDTLADSTRLNGKVWALPLHSSLPQADQVKVFERAPAGLRKVVLATNVAETSITIDDCAFVIDSGRAREVEFAPETGLSRLADVWVSQAAARQRRGRAGRVQRGTCFRLYSKATFEALDAAQAPEMHRVPLESLCLQVLTMSSALEASAGSGSGGGDVWRFLREALDPPPRASVERAMEVLYSVGALEGGEYGRWLVESGGRPWRLSDLGLHLGKMPVDARLGRMLIYAAVFGCLDPILTIAATLSTRSPFLAPFDRRQEADRAKRQFSKDRDKSDHLLSVRAYQAWTEAKLRGSRSERAFCQDNFLSSITLRTISDLRQQFRDVLVDAGFAPSRRELRGGVEDACNVNQDNTRLIRAVICAGLYPNVARVQKPDTKYAETVGGAMAKNALAKEFKFFTDPDGRVFLHPSSVNFTENDWIAPWLVYHNKQATSKVFIRDSTMVTPYALALFGGSLSVLYHQGEIKVDGWIRFAAPARLGVLVRGLRELLRRAVEEKLKHPHADVSGHPAVAVLLDILAFE